MRIRLTLDIERRRDEHDDQRPAIYDVSSAHVERADPHPEPDRPIGFRRGDDW